MLVSRARTWQKFDFLQSASPRRGRSSHNHSWPTNLTLEASELLAHEPWIAPALPLLASCLLQPFCMIIIHGTQHGHSISSELLRIMFADALHDNARRCSCA